MKNKLIENISTWNKNNTMLCKMGAYTLYRIEDQNSIAVLNNMYLYVTII